MKRTNSLFLSMLMALVLTIGAVGCSSNNSGDPVQGKQDGKEAAIAFQLSLPKGGKVIYPALKAIHDEAEWTVASLWMYVFDANTGAIVGAPKDIKASLTPDSSEEATWTYVHKYNPATDAGVYRFAFVANDNPGNVANETELLAKLATKKLAATNGTSKDLLDEEKNIPMTGYAVQPTNGSGRSEDIALTSTVAHAKVELTRIVARIDVQNQVSNLVIKELTLLKTNSESYLFPKKAADKKTPTYEAPASAARVSIKGFAGLPATGIQQAGELKKAFYLYEGPQPRNLDDYTAVEVSGELAGRPVKFIVPFVHSDDAMDTPVTVKRNHLYRIVLGGVIETVDGAKVKFKIEDTPWNAVLLNETYQAIAIDHEQGSYSLRWSPTRRYILTGTEFDDPFIFTLKSQFAGHTKFEMTTNFPGVQWCDVEITDSTKNPGTATLKLTRKTSLSIDQYLPAGTDKTSYTITIWSDAAPDYKVTITHEVQRGDVPKDENIIID